MRFCVNPGQCEGIYISNDGVLHYLLLISSIECRIFDIVVLFVVKNVIDC